MRNTTTRTTFAVLAATVFVANAAFAALTPEQRCEAVKLTVAGKYAVCRLAAESRAARTGEPADFTRCTGAFAAKWQSAETKATNAGGACVPAGDEADIKNLVDGAAADVTTALSGGGLPPVCGNGTVESGESCDVGNLNGETCATQGFAGGTLACAPGCTLDTSGCYSIRFDALGDTIIDNETGLEWEKKTTEPGSGVNLSDPHDVDNRYQWCAGISPTCTNPNNPFDGGAAMDFLAVLNGGGTSSCYAGHCDWRLPTVEELDSLPRPVGAEFQPDAAAPYWTSSTVANWSPNAWYVQSSVLDTDSNPKTTLFNVRAVRGGD